MDARDARAKRSRKEQTVSATDVWATQALIRCMEFDLGTRTRIYEAANSCDRKQAILSDLYAALPDFPVCFTVRDQKPTKGKDSINMLFGGDFARSWLYEELMDHHDNQSQAGINDPVGVIVKWAYLPTPLVVHTVGRDIGSNRCSLYAYKPEDDDQPTVYIETLDTLAALMRSTYYGR
jgi:hypothetical protein